MAAPIDDQPPPSLAALIDSLPDVTPGAPTTGGNGTTPAAPPGLSKTADEMFAELNRVPLFMTHLDETDGAGGENIALEGLRAIAYEGTRAEVAQGFRESGNEAAREKRWKDARGFYDQALAALKEPRENYSKPEDDDEAEEGFLKANKVEEVLDEEEETKKELAIAEACHINKALCNLEMKNYRACTFDCAATLRINPKNVKAFYRSASACFALDRIEDARDSCLRGLAVDPSNAALKTLSQKVEGRQKALDAKEKERQARAERKVAEAAALRTALQSRFISWRTTPGSKPTEELTPSLEDPVDPSSTLTVPTLLLYPLIFQSDVIQAFSETDSLSTHLSYILPTPWDEKGEYTQEGVVCYLKMRDGGIVKLGKKIKLAKAFESKRVEIVDGSIRVFVLPEKQSSQWVAEEKERDHKAKSG